MISKLELLTGRVSSLEIEDRWDDFVTGMSRGIEVDLSASRLANSGLAGAATSALFADAGGLDRVQNFTARLDGVVVAGRFSQVSFAEEDYLECAAEAQPDGTFAVYAARRPADHTLWMFPHCSRGSDAHWRYARKMAVIVSLLCVSGPLIAFAFLCDFDLTGRLFTVYGSVIFLTGAIMGTALSLGLAKKWMMFVDIAEAIFALYGYHDPTEVDLPEEDRQFWKANPARRGERLFAPWVFRYRSETATTGRRSRRSREAYTLV